MMALNTLSTDTECSFQYIYILVQLFSQEVMHRLCENEVGIEDWSLKANSKGSDYVKYQFPFEAWTWDSFLTKERAGLSRSLSNLMCFHHPAIQEEQTSNTVEALRAAALLDLNVLLARYDDLLERFNAVESKSISRRGDFAAQGAADQAEGVQRLTTLAFFFIPLSFVASLFGMNIEELGSGDGNIHKVVIASLITLLVVTAVWWISGYVSATLRTIRKNFDGLRFRWRVIKDFARISPVGSFWIMVYSMTHSPDESAMLVRELGIWVVLGLAKSWEAPQIGTASQLVPLSPFWQARANSIARVTAAPGWETTRFWIRRRRITPTAETAEPSIPVPGNRSVEPTLPGAETLAQPIQISDPPGQPSLTTAGTTESLARIPLEVDLPGTAAGEISETSSAAPRETSGVTVETARLGDTTSQSIVRTTEQASTLANTASQEDQIPLRAGEQASDG